MQQHGSQQQLRQPGMQQPGYSPGPGPGMYAEQGGIQQQAGMYPGMAQAYPTSAAEQLSRPMSPPGLPRGPSQPATVSQRSQIKSPSGQFLGPQMIRPAMATNPMAAHQMAGNQMVGGQMAGNQMAGHHMRTSQMPGSRMAGNQIVGNTVSSPKSPSAMQPASLQSAVASGSNGMAHAQAQAQAGPQASNSASSRPNSASSRPGSASSQEGTGGSGQSHVMPQGRAGAGQADVSAPQAAVTYPSGQVGPQMQQAGYGASGYGSRWTGGLQAGMNRYPSSSQPSMMHGETPLLLALPSAHALANHTMLLLVWYVHRPYNAFVTSMYCYYCCLCYCLFAHIHYNPECKQSGMFNGINHLTLTAWSFTLCMSG